MDPSPSTRHWCDLLAIPGAPVGRIGTDNQSLGRTTIDAALNAGHTFAIAIRTDVVPIDVDDEQPEVIDDLIRFMESMGWEYLVFGSGRLGHHHVYVVAASEPHANSVADVLRTHLSQVDATVVHRGYLRPPGTPHRSGRPTSPVPLWASPKAVELLERRPAPAHRARVNETPAPPAPGVAPGQLDAATFALLTTGQGLERFCSRSEAIYALLMGMRRAGWSETQVMAALEHGWHRGAEPWRSIVRGDRHTDGTARRNPRWWLRRQWETVCRRVASTSFVATSSDGVVSGTDAAWLHAVEELSRTSPRTLATTMLVAGELAVSPVDRAGHRRASERGIAERACLDPGTARRALHRLIDAGLLERVETGTITASASGVGVVQASRWRLVTDSGTGGTPPPEVGDTTPRRATLPDVFRSTDVDAALSPNARLLLLKLLDGPMDLEECARALEMTPRSMLIAQTDRVRGGPLRQLLELGLVRQRADRSFHARPSVTAVATRAAQRLDFHGRRAIDRRRRLRVRHRTDRDTAIRSIASSKRAAMRAHIVDHYLQSGRSRRCAETVADRILQARGLQPNRHEARAARRLEVGNVDRPARTYAISAREVVVKPGDAAITRRMRAAGARPIWVRQLPFPTALGAVWRIEGFIIDASRLAERINDIDDVAARIEQRIDAPDDLATVLAELEVQVATHH